VWSRFLSTVVCLVALLLGACSSRAASPAEEQEKASLSAELVTRFGPQPFTGKVAPDFTLNDLSGKPMTLSALRGSVVLLDFWATWCPPCQASMPHLERLHQEFGAKGLTVLGVTDEEKATVEPFLKANRVTFTILLDPKQAAVTSYRVTTIPRTLIIDREGKVAADFAEPQQESSLRAELAKLGIK
jgi:peroxiredoxin